MIGDILLIIVVIFILLFILRLLYEKFILEPKMPCDKRSVFNFNHSSIYSSYIEEIGKTKINDYVMECKYKCKKCGKEFTNWYSPFIDYKKDISCGDTKYGKY